MIVKMSKVEIAGQRELLEKVLFILQETGLLQIEPVIKGFIEKKDEVYVDSLLPDKSKVSERFFLEEMREKIGELQACLPPVPAQKSFMNPQPVIDTISETLRQHLHECREISRRKNSLLKEADELDRYNVFLDAIEPLVEGVSKTHNMDFIGLTLRDPGAVKLLRHFLEQEAGDRFQLKTAEVSGGTIAVLIAIDRQLFETVKNALTEKDIPEFKFPVSFEGLTFFRKMELMRRKTSEIRDEIASLDMQLESLAAKWSRIYARVMEWIDESLNVLNAAGSVYETKMCFLIYGWMASSNVGTLRKRLGSEFEGKVVLEELEITEEDLDRMPVMLKNPSYFKPFELFTRILPLPKYTSYDPTPFVAVFFPVFFGMILGDAGYGLLLLILSIVLMRKFRSRETVSDASRILLICSLYAVCFGILYGEFFGELGHVVGLGPVLIERRTSIMPMLYFAVSVGVVHVLIGSVLGLVNAVKRKTGKEALGKLLNILMLICVLLFVASLFGLFPALLTRPVVLAILLLTPFLLFTGGVLAPLELIKSIGNIISYARIMAIGLTSVLLAYVANRIAGMTGDIITGIAAAGLLHLLNIIIGVFSPTIHSLRLHYVEFFSKFLESGGRKFEPLRKKDIM